MKEIELIQKTTEPIIKWYQKNKRDLPWRKEKNPYHIWLSEIMLQQTRIEAVKQYYKRFLEELPTIQDLAEVEEEKLLKLWEGLGYYNRAKNLKKAAQMIQEKYQGQMPRKYSQLIQLPGIGEYTAGAISSIEIPVRNAKIKRKKEEKTVFLLEFENKIAIRKREQTGLLANMYEFPNIDKKINTKTVEEVLQNWGLAGKDIEKIGTHHHIFSHIEWDMVGYKVQVNTRNQEFIWVEKEKILKQYPIPSAFEPFRKKI